MDMEFGIPLAVAGRVSSVPMLAAVRVYPPIPDVSSEKPSAAEVVLRFWPKVYISVNGCGFMLEYLDSGAMELELKPVPDVGSAESPK